MDRDTADEPYNCSTPVLVVEDFSTMARILRNLLHQIGLENVDDARGARIALEMMRKKHYELLITDCNMPGMSGYELLREVRTDPHLEMTPVLLMTADPSVLTLIRETDRTQYLIKPFSAGMLKAKLQGLLALRLIENPNGESA